MSFQEKIYVAHDGANDRSFYEHMQTWTQSDSTPFNFIDGYEYFMQLDKEDDEVLKNKIYQRMDEAKVVVVLFGQYTKSYRRFTRWQIEYAINTDKPIIAININGIRSVDFDRCPTILKKNLAVHIASQAPILEYALMNWPQSHKEHREEESNHPYRYDNSVYDELKLETFDL
jgi:hypothetical protein